MSKKNRTRFRDRVETPVVSHTTPLSTARSSGSDNMSQHAAEYRIITMDMIRLVALNGFMLAAVIVVYYTNRNSGYLERLFERLF